MRGKSALAERNERQTTLTTGPKRATGRCLTKRERLVLFHVLCGASNLAIAKCLACSIKTVEFHVTNILRKSGEKSRLRLVLRALGPRPVGGVKFTSYHPT
jgi:DNA-binding NarL/FixJ family response regulator